MDSYEVRLVVTLLILLEVFLLAILASTYIGQPGRTITLCFVIAIVAIVMMELLLLIWATGVVLFFTYKLPTKSQRRVEVLVNLVRRR